MTLTEFLLARIAEDEAVAAMPSLTQRDWELDSIEPSIVAIGWVIASEVQPIDAGLHIARHDPARVPAECEAKRRIVELHRADPREDDEKCMTCAQHADSWPCRTLATLALPYADHPDYDQAWRP